MSDSSSFPPPACPSGSSFAFASTLPPKGRDMFALFAVSPLDGRYFEKTESLRSIFSEYSLIKKRVEVEILWFIHMAEHKIFSLELDQQMHNFLKSIMDLSAEDALRIKEIEKKTNHDVKSVELFIKEKIRESKIEELISKIEMIHFACTSEDINNLSYALIFKEAVHMHILPALYKLLDTIKELAIRYADVPMLSLTHGQPATPTTFGKEMAIFASRLHRHISHSILRLEYLGKINGAVGNFNAHFLAVPNADWVDIAKSFVETKLLLKYQAYSNQIECHDFIGEMSDAIARVNTTLIDLNCDMWTYISRDILKLKKIEDEVGSSTMPHKINPIDFENSEGNLGMANALLKFFSTKLPISRMQRDLSDSTVLRNVGVSVAYSLIGYLSTLKGLSKISINGERMHDSLQNQWALLAEPIQTVLRKYNAESPYEVLKELTRGQECNEEKIREIIKKVCTCVNEEDMNRLLALTPHTYVGIAEQLAKDIDKHTQ